MPRLIKVEKLKKPPYAAIAYEGLRGLRLSSWVSLERRELVCEVELVKRVMERVVGEGRIEIFFEYKKLRSWLNLLIELVVMIVVFIIFLFTLRIQYSHITRKIQRLP